MLDGPRGSFFSGLPLSSRATLLLLALAILAVVAAMFPPRRAPRRLWPALLLLVVVAKLLLAPALVVPGWKGVYRFAFRDGPGRYLPMVTSWFQTRGPAARPYRLDARIDFDGPTFGLTSVNEIPQQVNDYSPDRRDVLQPLVVRWTGYVARDGAAPLTMSVAANGRVVIDVDGQRKLDARDPSDAVLTVPLGAGIHRIDMLYVKRAGVVPRIRMAAAEAITSTPAGTRTLRRSALAGRAIDTLGFLALLLLLGASLDGYGALRGLLAEMRARPDKLAAVAIAAALLGWGARISIPGRHTTVQQTLGDDPLIYERDARWIARNGLLLIDDRGEGIAYFFYPLYSYALAGAHILFGDDASTIVLFNYICLAAALLLLWALLRNYLARGALALLLLVVALPFAVHNYRQYAAMAFTDNLFAPMVLAMLVVCVTAFQRRSMGWLFATGVVTALAAAARASLMTHVAFLCAAVLLYRDFGGIGRRLRGCAMVAAGFALGLAPFTIRNWVVAGQFVLLVSSVTQMPYFMYIENRPSLLVNGTHATFVQSMQQMAAIFLDDPVYFIVHELRKVIFTLGFVNGVGPQGVTAPRYLAALPLLFGLALKLRRVPRPMAATLLAFCASHMTSMVMAAPWTYGYKTILPFMYASIAGGAFLLRRAGEPAPALQTARLAHPTVSVIVLGDGARAKDVRAACGADEVLAATDLRSALPATRGALVAVFPADGAYEARDLRRLMRSGRDYDVVLGSRLAEGRARPPRAAWALAKLAGAAYRGDHELLTDLGCPMWLMRREVLAALLESPRASAARLPFLALRAGYRVIQVPVTWRSTAARRPLS